MAANFAELSRCKPGLEEEADRWGRGAGAGLGARQFEPAKAIEVEQGVEC